MARPRPPPLYRLSRILQLSTIPVIIAIVALLIFAGVSILHISSSNVSGANTVEPALGNQSAGLSGDLSITNPGYASVNSVNFNGLVRLDNGTVLTHIGLPKLSLGPGGTGRIPFVLTISLKSGDAGSILLFQSHSLTLLFALNVSYAVAFTAQVLATGTFSWGAPFDNLTFTPTGPLIEGGNGSAELPLTVSFVNHARFPIVGMFQVEVQNSTGVVCGTSSLPVNVTGGHDLQFVGDTAVDGASSCLANASMVTLVYQATGHISIAFPPQVLA